MSNKTIPGTGSQWLTVQQTADLMGVHHSTVRRWISTGEVEAVRIGATSRSPIRIPAAQFDPENNSLGRPLGPDAASHPFPAAGGGAR